MTIVRLPHYKCLPPVYNVDIGTIAQCECGCGQLFRLKFFLDWKWHRIWRQKARKREYGVS